MATCYITAEPCTIKEFLVAAKLEGFLVENDSNNSAEYTGFFRMLHADGRGCFGCSEEEHDGEIYVGSMNNPELGEIEMVEEDSDEYREICGDEYEEDEDEDEDEEVQ